MMQRVGWFSSKSNRYLGGLVMHDLRNKRKSGLDSLEVAATTSWNMEMAKGQIG